MLHVLCLAVPGCAPKEAWCSGVDSARQLIGGPLRRHRHQQLQQLQQLQLFKRFITSDHHCLQCEGLDQSVPLRMCMVGPTNEASDPRVELISKKPL